MNKIKEDILAANHHFYEVFCSKDLDAMRDLWAPNENIACVHPGWGLLEGWKDVMSSWEGIFENPSTPGIRPVGETVFQQSGYAFVVCGESVEGAEPSLVATNIFEESTQGWKLVHHHVSPILQITEDFEEAQEPTEQLH